MCRGRDEYKYQGDSEEGGYPCEGIQRPVTTIAEEDRRQPCPTSVQASSGSNPLHKQAVEDQAGSAPRSFQLTALCAQGQTDPDVFDIEEPDDDAIADYAATRACVDAVRATGFEASHATPVEPDPRTHLRVFAPALAAAKLVEAGVDYAKPLFISSSDRGSTAALQERWWRRMHEDAALGWRPRLMALPEHGTALDNLRPTMPNFACLLEIVGDALSAAFNTGTSVRMPPMLLLGPPGVGKSHAAAAIAAALGAPTVSLSMTTTTSVNPLGGTDAVWRNPKLGVIAQTLIAEPCASPILFLDEIDKAFTSGSHDRPLDPLHALLEPQTARAFRDEFLELDLDASGIIWIATANGLDGIAPSIVDRFLVLQIEAPSADRMGAMIRVMLAKSFATHGGWFEASVEDGVIARLASLHPRRLRRVIDLACMAAAAGSERRLTEKRVIRAILLMEAGLTKPAFGFRG
jgi:ATP-dependent Lon protease